MKNVSIYKFVLHDLNLSVYQMKVHVNIVFFNLMFISYIITIGLFIGVPIKGKTEVKVGETVHLEGLIQFCSSVRYLKWQKRHGENFIDINTQKPKYQGTRNYLPNPKLVINDIELEDGVEYRVKFQRISKTEYSKVHRIKTLPIEGKRVKI